MSAPLSSTPARLVLVHGTRQHGGMWDAYPALLPDLEVVAVDLPGHGQRIDEAFTLDAALASIEEAVRGATPNQPVVLAGHSLGGYLATAYAARHGHRLASVILIGASADPQARVAWPYKAFAQVLPHVRPERMAAAANWVMARFGTDSDALPDGSSYAALPEAWRCVFQHCGPDLLDAIRCPVVIVNGQFDQMRIHARAYAARSQAEVVTVPRTTHLLPLTHPEATARVLARVGQQVTARASAGSVAAVAPTRRSGATAR